MPKCSWPSSAGPTGSIRTRVLDFAKAQGEALRLGAQDDGEVVVEIGDRKEVVAPVIEQTITSALQRLARRRSRCCAAWRATANGGSTTSRPQGFQLARIVAERNGIDTRGLDLTVATSIPEDCTILAMVAPTAALLPDEIELINDFMANNGKMLLLSEPGGPNLDAITHPLGPPAPARRRLRPARGPLAGDPTSLLVNDFPTESPVSKDVDTVGFVTAGGITTAASEDAGLSVARVLQSSRAVLARAQPGGHSGDLRSRTRATGAARSCSAGAADRSEVKATGENRLPAGEASIARTRLLVFTDADWASPTPSSTAWPTDRLLANGLNWLAGEEDLVAIRGVDPDLRRLKLTSSQRRLMGIGSIGAIPAAVLLVGAGVWFRRRRR